MNQREERELEREANRIREERRLNRAWRNFDPENRLRREQPRRETLSAVEVPGPASGDECATIHADSAVFLADRPVTSSAG